MDRKILVNIDVDGGKEVVEALDRSDLKVISAFWLYYDEAEEWRLLIAIPSYDNDGPLEAYRKVLHVLEENNMEKLFEPISVISPSDHRSKAIRASLKTGDEITGKWYSGFVSQGTYIGDIYLYRAN